MENILVNIEDSKVTIFFNNTNNLFPEYEYSLDNGNIWNIPNIRNNKNNHYFIINELINDKKYNIIIRLNKEKITVIEVIPNSFIQPPIINNIINENSYAIISFTPSNTNDSDIFYEYSIDNGIIWNTIKTNEDGNYKVENLTNGEIYNFIMRANNLKQISKQTNPIILKPVGPPEPPKSFVVTFNNSLLNVSFIQCNNNGSKIIGYYYSTDNCITWKDLNFKYSSYGTVYACIGELIYNKKYTIYLCSYNIIGRSVLSKPIIVMIRYTEKIEKNLKLSKNYECILEESEIEEYVFNEQIIEESSVPKYVFNEQIVQESGVQEYVFNEKIVQESGFQEYVFNEKIVQESGFQEYVFNEQIVQESSVPKYVFNEKIVQESGVQEYVFNEQIVQESGVQEYVFN